MAPTRLNAATTNHLLKDAGGRADRNHSLLAGNSIRARESPHRRRPAH